MFFEYPKILYLLFLLAPMLALYVWRAIKGDAASLRLPGLAPLRHAGGKWRTWLRHIPFLLKWVAVAALIVAIARPRSSSEFERTDTEGIDIIIALDVSTSMLARDFKPDRIGASKEIAIQFIAGRPSDRMGIVVYAGESYTQCPLTTDRVTLINMIKDIQPAAPIGVIEDGTAIGNGLSTAVARLKDSDAKSRVVILLTDGMNNRGEITPLTAAEIAKTYGVRVYTIGIGSIGTAPYPYQTPYGVTMQQMPVEIDEDLLRQIAQITDGAYFRATDNTKLMEIYGEINQMEKTKTLVDSFPVYKELFMQFALICLLALAFDLFLRLIVLRTLP